MIEKPRIIMVLQNILVILLFISYGCSEHHIAKGTPECIEMKIDWISRQEVSNPPVSVSSYLYEGKTVFYIPAKCCDIPSQLYDADCNYICAPDGGFGGSGDGKCPDFTSRRTQERLLWTDDRKP